SRSTSRAGTARFCLMPVHPFAALLVRPPADCGGFRRVPGGGAQTASLATRTLRMRPFMAALPVLAAGGPPPVPAAVLCFPACRRMLVEDSAQGRHEREGPRPLRQHVRAY